MHAFEFLRGRKGNTPKPVYAVVGDDAYLRRECVGAIVRGALGSGDDEDDLALTRFSGDQAALADVLDELRLVPFLSPRRVVSIENADPFVTAHRKELEAYAERPAASGVLILMVKTWPATTRLAKLVNQVGVALDCKAPKENELGPWLVKLAADHEAVKLDPDAALLLVELVGAEVGLLAMELGKLATYVGERREITRADVGRMVGAGRVESIWRILDAATTGQAAEALDHLDRLLTSGEHPVALLAAITASLRKLHQAGELRAGGRELREACGAAGIPPFAVEQTRRQHAHLGRARVHELPNQLLQTDLNLKGSSGLEPRVVLEELLLRLARPRRD